MSQEVVLFTKSAFGFVDFFSVDFLFSNFIDFCFPSVYF